MSTMMKGLIGTQFLAAAFGFVYFLIFHHKNHPDAVGIGLRVWGYLAALMLVSHVFLMLKLWWEKSRRR
jgi:hypothetical protein